MSFLALLTLILVYSLQKRILTTTSVYSDTLKTYSDTKFRQVVGFPRDIFNQMVELVEADYRQVHTRRGRPSKLTSEDKVLITAKLPNQYDVGCSLWGR